MLLDRWADNLQRALSTSVESDGRWVSCSDIQARVQEDSPHKSRTNAEVAHSSQRQSGTASLRPIHGATIPDEGRITTASASSGLFVKLSLHDALLDTAPAVLPVLMRHCICSDIQPVPGERDALDPPAEPLIRPTLQPEPGERDAPRRSTDPGVRLWVLPELGEQMLLFCRRTTKNRRPDRHRTPAKTSCR